MKPVHITFKILYYKMSLTKTSVLYACENKCNIIFVYMELFEKQIGIGSKIADSIINKFVYVNY